ncbi:MAG: RING finger protein [Candidatus Dependentiae bacterium]|nr:RING finger protein [Candidatus Dependentiae bacterium]
MNSHEKGQRGRYMSRSMLAVLLLPCLSASVEMSAMLLRAFLPAHTVLHAEIVEKKAVDKICPYCLEEIGEGPCVRSGCGHACHVLCFFRDLLSRQVIKKLGQILGDRIITSICPVCRTTYSIGAPETTKFYIACMDQAEKAGVDEQIELLLHLPLQLVRTIVGSMGLDVRKKLFTSFSQEDRYRFLSRLSPADWDFYLGMLGADAQRVCKQMMPKKLSFIHASVDERKKRFAALDVRMQRAVLKTFFQDLTAEEKKGFSKTFFARVAFESIDAGVDMFQEIAPLLLHRSHTSGDLKILFSRLYFHYQLIGLEELACFARLHEHAAICRSYIKKMVGLLGTAREKIFFLKGAWAAKNLSVCLAALKDLVATEPEELLRCLDEVAEAHVAKVAHHDEHFYDLYDVVADLFPKQPTFAPDYVRQEYVWQIMPREEGQRLFAQLPRRWQRSAVLDWQFGPRTLSHLQDYRQNLEDWWARQPRREQLRYIDSLPAAIWFNLHASMSKKERKAAFQTVFEKVSYLEGLPAKEIIFYIKEFPEVASLLEGRPEKIFCYTPGSPQRIALLKKMFALGYPGTPLDELHQFQQRYAASLTKKEHETIFCGLWQQNSTSCTFDTALFPTIGPKALFALLSSGGKADKKKGIKRGGKRPPNKYAGLKRGRLKKVRRRPGSKKRKKFVSPLGQTARLATTGLFGAELRNTIFGN